MVCLDKYNLFKIHESEFFYKIQEKLISDYQNTNDINCLVKIALLLTNTPACGDYYETIKILYDCVLEEDNYYAYIIGSYLSSTWLNFKPNKFLERIQTRKTKFSFKIQSDLENYLIAYDIYMRGDNGSRQECISILRESIKNSKMVNNFLLLSRLVERKEAKQLALEAKRNAIQNSIIDYSDENDFVMDPDMFVKEEIIGYKVADEE